MSKRQPTLSFDFTKTKHAKTEDMKSVKKEKKAWKNFAFKGDEVPDKMLMNKLAKDYKEKFNVLFKSAYFGESMKVVDGELVSTFNCKFTFSCTPSEEAELDAFFRSEGFEAEISEVNFSK